MDEILSLQVRCPAKVNLGLAVLGRRDDGFHDVETILAAISLGDNLTVRLADRLSLTVHGQPGIPTDRRNLVWRAAEAFAAAAGTSPGARIEISKHVPPGSGLGGGSSDAAGTLAALNRLHGDPLDRERLHGLAAGLGADVPFFLDGGIALAEGRGERLTRLGHKKIHIVLAFPQAAVSTAWAYKQLSAENFGKLPREEIEGWLSGGAAPPELPNAFTAKIIRSFQEIGRTLDVLRASGLKPVSLSGSGSCCFGVARDEKEAFGLARELESRGIASIPTEVLDKGVSMVENKIA
ncbi:MAG: 4-(cytidine 5'-diphospho)-2-C-methyl-D-erythritol kinase [Candidatus Coatesbacteria bacterium RBG_13_66_14]|uniref:4-diphosphocytidyl-2-C-methyl-D-erythritol kinase n=1 Tax=Candidatus Coatesbacteria bacterium RBG_13_66_14 TaxID=1817816 RepID=A0A1F5FAX6_9BACT|nr:MAG: 4-(cytidine 5'-diphospho)-2-C-methyl-D-erythritol kinase [Candidatus Coatesbacteria bacterium RBG_13_66_14]